MSAGTVDFTEDGAGVLEQGATFSHTFTLTDANDDVFPLTGYSARMQLRKKAGGTDLYASWSTTTGHMTIDADEGTITLVVPAEETAALDFKTAVYDVEIEDGDGFVTRLLQGAVVLSPEVTL